MPGPPKTPVELTLLRGNPGKRPVNRNRPKPRGAPVKPRDLSDDASKEWDAVVRDYAHTGVLTGVDVGVLRIYCEAMARYRVAEKLAATGPLIKGARAGELVRNPAHMIARDNAELALRAARELGFTPASRSALGGPGGAAEEDAFSAWESRRGNRSG
jgi:P27 family predicted phage terminase small subunit